jgi:hypothetical protein
MKMKSLAIGLFTILSVAMASQSVLGHLLSTAGSVFMWSSTTHDFGKITQSQMAEHEFVFTNEGDLPLIISNAKASCGCTVAEYTKEPIAAGAQGKVTARYDAAKVGAFTKTVTITANTGGDAVVLTLKGEVIAAE